MGGLGHHLRDKDGPMQQCKEGGTQMKIKNEPYIIVHQRFEREQWKPLKNGETRRSRPRPTRRKANCRNSKEVLSEASEGETENETTTTTITTSNGRIVKKKKNCTCPA